MMKSIGIVSVVNTAITSPTNEVGLFFIKKGAHKMKQEAIREERELYIAKKNELIQKSRYQLSTLHNKVLLYLISKIEPQDDLTKMYSVSIRDFCSVCNIALDSGTNYKNVRDAIKGLADKSIWVMGANGRYTLCRWLNEVELDANSATVYFSFHKSMIGYLSGLRSNYTQYKLVNVLCMKSKYAIRLYELLKSYENMDRYNEDGKAEITIPLDALKRCLGAESYIVFKDFKKRVFLPAIEEIEQYTNDIAVEYEFQRDGGREYKKVHFSISFPTAENYQERKRKQAEILEIAPEARKCP